MLIYITDTRRISQKGYTVYGKNMLVKNGYVCSVSTEHALIDPRDKYKLYTSLIAFTKHFIGNLSLILNHAHCDTAVTDWKNSLNYCHVKAYEHAKQFERELTASSTKLDIPYVKKITHGSNNINRGSLANQVYSEKLSESVNMNSPNKSHLQSDHTNRFSDKDRVYNETLSEPANMDSDSIRSYSNNLNDNKIQTHQVGGNAQVYNNVDNENEEHIYSFESILNNVDNSNTPSEHSSNNIMENSESNDTSSKVTSAEPTNAFQFGGEVVNKLKEYHHKYTKYKYKHEMLKRRVIKLLNKNKQMGLLQEILKYD